MREGKDSRRGSIRHRFTLGAMDTGVKRYKGWHKIIQRSQRSHGSTTSEPLIISLDSLANCAQGTCEVSRSLTVLSSRFLLFPSETDSPVSAVFAHRVP